MLTFLAKKLTKIAHEKMSVSRHASTYAICAQYKLDPSYLNIKLTKLPSAKANRKSYNPCPKYHSKKRKVSARGYNGCLCALSTSRSRAWGIACWINRSL